MSAFVYDLDNGQFLVSRYSTAFFTLSSKVEPIGGFSNKWAAVAAMAAASKAAAVLAAATISFSSAIFAFML